MARRTRAELEQALGRAQAALLKLGANHLHIEIEGENPDDHCLTCRTVDEGLGEIEPEPMRE